MTEGISYHAKDILFKSLSELYKDTALHVFGLENLPKIKELLPNEFPEVRVDEKRSDTLFLLEDNSILMLEYESNSRVIGNHLKYLEYAVRIMNRNYSLKKEINKIRVVVVYTSDVSKANAGIQAGDITIVSKAIFLHEYNGDAILEKLSKKIDTGKILTREELMKLSLIPLMYSKKERQELIKDSMELAKNIYEETDQLQVIAGILTATDKFIDKDYAKKVREWIRMTKVGRIFEEEKQEAIKEIAKSLLEILTPEEVAKRTKLEIEEVKKLMNN